MDPLAPSSASPRNPPVILVVDDEPRNLQLVGSLLKDLSYDTVIASNGQEALDSASEEKPDLILLDIMMPRMDGFEVCKRLKENPRTKDIPVIFLTAKTETDDIVQGFTLGGVDYVTKPFKAPELLARVETHVALKRSKEEIENLNRAQSRVFSIVSQDLRDPFWELRSFADMLAREAELLSKEDLQFIGEELMREAQSAGDLLESLYRWTNLQVNRLDFFPVRMSVVDWIEGAIDDMRGQVERKRLTIKRDLENGLFALADIHMATTIMRNLLSNAVKYSHPGGDVIIRGRQNNGVAEVTIEDFGVGMDTHTLEHVFDIEARQNSAGTERESGTGLGLLICRQFLERHGGTIEVQSTLNKGTCVSFTLPIRGSGDEDEDELA